MELERLLSLEDVVDVVEVRKLRLEVRDLRKLNEDLEETSKNLVIDNNVAADKLFAALTEKSELITECDVLSGQVKSLQSEVLILKKSVAASEEGLSKGVEAWTTKKAEFADKLDSLSTQLSKCQAESLSSFEECYKESVARFARFGIDVKDHSFDNYLADLVKKNELGKTGSSEAIQDT